MHAAPRGIDGEIEEKITEQKHGNFKISLMYVYMESTDAKNCQGTKTRVIDEDDRVQYRDEEKKKRKNPQHPQRPCSLHVTRFLLERSTKMSCV